MKALRAEDVRQAVHGRWFTRPVETLVKGVSTDTRTARREDLFVALLGDRFDGHAFLPEAHEAGCPAAIIRRDHPLSMGILELFEGGVIAVEDTRKALGDLGAYYRGQARAAVVAVTGSNGKTTVKRMIHHILSRRLRGSCSPKSFNNDIGVPLTLLDVDPGDDYVVCEVGSSAPGEVQRLARICRPNVAVINSVARVHLEGFGTLERIAAEKASLLGALEVGGLAVVWGDSQVLDKAVRGYAARVVRFGLSEACDLRVTGWEARGRGQRFQLNGRIQVDMPIPGRHNAVNALAAIAVAQRFGFEQEEAAAALKDLESIEMRLQWIDAGGGSILNDAYNANPASVLAAADVLESIPARRRVMVVADMRELGGASESLHLQTGREIADRKIDLLIGVGSLGTLIAEGASGRELPTASFPSVAAACGGLPELLCAGDLVLVKGSRAMEMERLIEPMREALEKLAGDRAEKKQGGRLR
ncbi:MAG TPA: UDP-N-acetylmuramoyl-tripeptide--D-alanyl-D-alanine ligase [Phycisphaerae bacterium]|nr:UDP-N-acetylmuramoyl-tripeptide--D-alanyl-D-alanine ligase [Phycisphaerae bacterium]